MRQDHYTTLGVPYKASQNEVVAAYKKLAKKYHPDKNPSASAHERFIAIHEAYSILKDPAKRIKYDRSRAVRRYNPETNTTEAPFRDETSTLGNASALSSSLVIVVSFLGIVFTSLVGIVIIAAPAILYFPLSFVDGVPLRVFIMVSVAIPYWFWLYRMFEKRQ